MKLSELGELRLLQLFEDRLGVRREQEVLLALGDDCAVIGAGSTNMLLTADMLVEGVHFRRELIPPRLLGRKSVVVNLSDLAAMGGTPRYGLLSLGLPEDLDVDYVEELMAGIEDVASPLGMDIVGGDTTRSPHLVINLALVGECPRPVLRSRARPGEAVYITGPTGLAAAGLELMRAGRAEQFPRLVEAQNEPQARLAAGVALAASGLVGAMIDISDGLARDLGHVSNLSGVAATMEEALVPLDGGVREAADLLGRNPLDWALGGGEDYELLFTALPTHEARLDAVLAKAGCRALRVGEMERGRGVSLRHVDGRCSGFPRAGFDHFAA
ncbi:MAG: thiamine-phosphate kinase [Pseudomonadota bacterium]